MKFLDKIKNALFEEEYVEVEEKPKKKSSKEIKKSSINNDIKEEKPIAKKIVLPERKEVKITSHEEIEEEIQEEPIEEEKEHKFQMISDSEFETIPQEEKFEKPQVDYIDRTLEEREYASHFQEKPHPKLYGIDDKLTIKEPEYGTYEKKEDRTYFQPSPIISPIYGILDKNYKKEEIVSKREVRLTSSYSRENLDLDAIRDKAYGSLSNDIETAINQYDEDSTEESNFMDQDLLDLSNDSDTPEIKKVTVGDAEEYFNELGLEYNVDYKDSSKEKATGRRSEKTIEEDGPKIIEEKEFVPGVEKEEYEETKEIVSDDTNSDDIDDDNLFDLIDSMYDKE